jgi:hypothetical protein
MFYDGFECNSTCFNDFRKLIRVLCVTGKNHKLIFASSTPSGTPSGTQSGTPSDTPSDTPSCTKTVGELAVVISATNDGRIKTWVLFVLVASSY